MGTCGVSFACVWNSRIFSVRYSLATWRTSESNSKEEKQEVLNSRQSNWILFLLYFPACASSIPLWRFISKNFLISSLFLVIYLIHALHFLPRVNLKQLCLRHSHAISELNVVIFTLPLWHLLFFHHRLILRLIEHSLEKFQQSNIDQNCGFAFSTQHDR